MQNESVEAKALEACESEPIRIPGMVQSHGMLLVLRQSDFTVLQISENIFDLIGVHPAEMMHQPLSKLMDIGPIEKASRRLGERMPRLLNPIPLDIRVNGKNHQFDGILHRAGRVIILELERHVAEDEGYGGFGGFYEAIRETIAKIINAQNLDEVFHIGCDELRKLTQFSRVLAYRFDDDWNGTVIAESRADYVESLLHHRFPASDIPKQARELYTVNWLRLIPDVNYKPAKMVPPENPMTGQPLDMSNAVLRSVSPVHLEYMRNMGQAASMSISLLKGQKLWGLISCHHPEAHFLKYDTRVAAEFIGQMVSTQIVAREESAAIDRRLQLQGIYDDLLKNGGSFHDVATTLQANAAKLLALTDARGAAICMNGQVLLLGVTPTVDQVNALADWIVHQPGAFYANAQLSGAYPPAAEFLEKAAGVMSICIPRDERAMILWFRPEMKDQVAWAGNPSLSKMVSPDGKIHPRSSFATWLEDTAGRAKRWQDSERGIADELRSAIMGLAVKEGPFLVRFEPGKEFRASLANAIAQTAASQSQREDPAVSGRELKANSIREAADKGRLLLEGFTEFAVIFLNEAGEIENWSAGARRILGYTKAGVVGHGFDLLFSEEEVLAGKDEWFLETARIKGRCEDELWIYREDRTSLWGKLTVAQVVNDAGSVIGFSVIVEDITQQRAAEEELRATKLAAEAANVAKTAFLANISHEIRTPLGAVLGFSEIMAQKNQTSEQRSELYGRIKRNGDQLIALINDLLDVTKIEAGRLEVEGIEIDLASLLADVRETFHVKASEKSLNFTVKVTGELPAKVVSDPTRIRQILVNLLSNAIKFTEPGGTVTMECGMDRMLDGTKLAFRITDTGRGMSETEMARLFQPFAQADVSTTRQYGGTGLGLFVSQRLARALGGDLNIERSEVGVGTTFLARIEAGRVASADTFGAVGTAPTPAPKTDRPMPSFQQRHILVVDDSPDNRQLVELYLKGTKAMLDFAENGEVGVRKALENRYDLILMDIQMPIMDGNAAMKELIRKNYRPPVIALTANAMRKEREQSLDVGFRDYLTKPIDKHSLLATIAKWIGPSAERGEATHAPV